MSVLVKGMKMPNHCMDCILKNVDDDCTAQEWQEWGTWEAMRKGCPLVELPEKHGRLIDAEALIDTLEQAIAIMETMFKQLDLEADDGCLMELKAYRDIRNGIKEIDAVIEAEGVEE